MTKPVERAKARELRLGGMSIKDIAAQLGVTKSSVSVWVRDIQLTVEQQTTLHDKYHHYSAKLKGSQANYQKGIQRRLQYQNEGRVKAREGDPLHLAGCMLYWAEGTKSRTNLILVNSDPDMLVFFVRFLRVSLGIADQDIRLFVNCYDNNGLSVAEIENKWIVLLGLTRTNLRKTTVNRQPASSKQNGRKLLYGVCAVVVYQMSVVQRVFGAIQEYVGIDKPEWLL
jgi:hypothetical protein